MGKALLSLSLLIFLPSLLFGSVWDSNALGQKIKEKDSLENVGWERVEDGDTTTIFLDGEVKKKRVTYSDGYEEILDNEKTRVYLDEEGRIIRKIVSDSENSEEYNYFYTPFLSSFTLSVDSVVKERTEYLRTPEGALLGLVRDQNPVFFSEERVVYTLDGETEVVELVIVEKEEEIEWHEDGGYEEKRVENGVSVINSFDGNGRLLEKRSDEYTIHYYYTNEGELIESVKESIEGKEVVEYRNGKSLSATYYTEDGVIKRKRETLEDGTFQETRYIDGEARYIFLLDKDGERILEARGL